MAKRMRQKDKQLFTKHTHKTKAHSSAMSKGR